MRDDAKTTIDSAPAAENEARTLSAGKRVLVAALVLLIVAGVAAVTLFMAVIIPRQNRRHAMQTCVPVMQSAQKGETVRFGAYEQDSNAMNGSEEIEWIVLQREEDRLLLISKYALDCSPFHTSVAMATWDYSAINQWLNEAFYGEAFSAAEKCIVLSTDVTPDANALFDTDPGKQTKSHVFLLSIPEADELFDSQEARRCTPTAFAETHGASAPSGGCVWWLRTPGYDGTAASRVLADGSISYIGQPVDRSLAVRPAVWVSCADLEK